MYRTFSCEVTAAISVFQDKAVVTILMYQMNPPGIVNSLFMQTSFLFQQTNMGAGLRGGGPGVHVTPPPPHSH